MPEFVTEPDWQNHLLNDGTFLDVRAPGEFLTGAVPGAVNLPILNDDERHQVGLCYKKSGNDAATALGHQLVTGHLRQQRMQSWLNLHRTNPNLLVYCFRGGQRSEITQRWLKEAHVHMPRIAGGYKRIRQFLLTQMTTLLPNASLFCVSGHTGSGKTHLLSQLKKSSTKINVIDLENLAVHRGSAFGATLRPQPSQANFENQLSLQLWQLVQKSSQPIWLEDEARTIGRITLPGELYNALRTCPMVVIDEPRDQRAKTILAEYVIAAFAENLNYFSRAAAENKLQTDLTSGVVRISRRLGGARTQHVLKLLNESLRASLQDDDWSGHLAWISFLLEDYYDDFYQAHMDQQRDRILFRGSRQDVVCFIKNRSNLCSGS